MKLYCPACGEPARNTPPVGPYPKGIRVPSTATTTARPCARPSAPAATNPTGPASATTTSVYCAGDGSRSPPTTAAAGPKPTAPSTSTNHTTSASHYATTTTTYP